MGNLVYRNDVLDALGEEPLVWDENDDYDVATRNQWRYDVECIKEVPSAKPEHKTGKWIKANDGIDGHVECTECFKTYDWDTQAQYYDFCPSCGAKMNE